MTGIASLYRETDAVGLGQLVKRREVSPLELLDAAIAVVDENGYVSTARFATAGCAPMAGRRDCGQRSA